MTAKMFVLDERGEVLPSRPSNKNWIFDDDFASAWAASAVGAAVLVGEEGLNYLWCRKEQRLVRLTPEKLSQSSVTERRGVARYGDETCLFEQLVCDEDEMTRQALASNRVLPEAFVRKLAEDPSPEVQKTSLYNDHAPADVLVRFVKHKDIGCRVAVAGHNNTPPSVKLRMTKDRSVDVRHTLANDDETSFDVLAALAKDRSERVRQRVYYNHGLQRFAQEAACRKTTFLRLVEMGGERMLSHLLHEDVLSPQKLLWIVTSCKARMKASPKHMQAKHMLGVAKNDFEHRWHEMLWRVLVHKGATLAVAQAVRERAKETDLQEAADHKIEKLSGVSA